MGIGRTTSYCALPGGTALSLSEMMSYFFSREVLAGKNQYHCETCKGLRDAEKVTFRSSLCANQIWLIRPAISVVRALQLTATFDDHALPFFF
jgi:ubiquitin C-terminal hydrolase